MKIDELARVARADLFTSVASIDVPPARRPYARRVGVAVVAVVAIVGAIVVAATGEAPGRLNAGTGEGYFLPSYLPPVLREATASEAGPSPMAPPALLFFAGEVERDRPFERRGAMVRYYNVKDVLVSVSPDPDAEPVNLRHGVGFIKADDTEVERGQQLQFEVDDVQVWVGAKGLSPAQVIEFANGLEVGDGKVGLPRPIVGLSRFDTSMSSRGNAVRWTSGSSTSLALLSIGIGSERDLLPSDMFRGERIEIDGRPGYLLRSTGGDISLSWLGPNGHIFSLFANLDEAELRKMAASMREVSEAEWKAAVMPALDAAVGSGTTVATSR